jgi:hypothetical protein
MVKYFVFPPMGALVEMAKGRITHTALVSQIELPHAFGLSIGVSMAPR